MSILGDDIREALPILRSNAESTMTSTAQVARSGGEPVFNPETGLMVPPPDTIVHTGPARLRQPTTVETNTLFGEQDVTKQRFIVDLPHDVTGVRLSDVITFTTADDPEAVGRNFQVVALSIRDHMVTRSFGVEVVE